MCRTKLQFRWTQINYLRSTAVDLNMPWPECNKGHVIINYEYPAAAGAGFRFLLILPLPSKKNGPEGRNKAIYMNLDVRYGILKEGRQTDRRILLFYCYV